MNLPITYRMGTMLEGRSTLPAVFSAVPVVIVGIAVGKINYEAARDRETRDGRRERAVETREASERGRRTPGCFLKFSANWSPVLSPSQSHKIGMRDAGMRVYYSTV